MDDQRYIVVNAYPVEDVQRATFGDHRRWIESSSESVFPCSNLARSPTCSIYSLSITASARAFALKNNG